MENYTRVTRFCIICNYVSRSVFDASLFVTCIYLAPRRRIIGPIASRCAKFRFQVPLARIPPSALIQNQP